MRPPPAVSIVVPTRDRPEALAHCLAALRSGDPAASQEIVVVDDASRDRAEIERIVAGVPNARLVVGAGRGPAAARNAGARAARAPVVCFTDDDCEPAPEWAGRLSAALVDGVAVVGGATVNGRPRNPFASASQAITNFLADRGRVPFAASNNVCCATDLARALPFDESYPAAAGEDREWCLALASRGHALARERRAVVTHLQLLDLAGFARQQFRYGRGAFRFHHARHGRATQEPPRLRARLVAHGFGHGAAVGVLVLAAQALVSAGYATELIASRRQQPRV